MRTFYYSSLYTKNLAGHWPVPLKKKCVSIFKKVPFAHLFYSRVCKYYTKYVGYTLRELGTSSQRVGEQRDRLN